MLPEGFEWRHHIDGPALYLGGKMLANITPLDTGQFRICLNPGNLAIRYEFFDSLEVSIIYVEQWVERWEARLRRVPH